MLNWYIIIGLAHVMVDTCIRIRRIADASADFVNVFEKSRPIGYLLLVLILLLCFAINIVAWPINCVYYIVLANKYQMEHPDE